MPDIRIDMPNGANYRPHGDVVVEHMRVTTRGQARPQPTRTIDLGVDGTLHTAVLLSLFTDRRAEQADVANDASMRDAPLRGSAMDDVLPEGDRFGSRLWTLRHGKAIPETLRRAEYFAREALDWMRAQAIVDRIVATASWHETRADRMLLLTQLYRGDSKLYDNLWRLTLAA